MGLKKLLEHRNDILFAEIGALIHDLGKLSKEFVEYYCLDSISTKSWKNDFHSFIIKPQIFSIEDKYLKIWEEYKKGAFQNVENELYSIFIEKNSSLSALEDEIKKRLKILKKGKAKTFDQIKSTLSHKGKPYRDRSLGEIIDSLLDTILKPLIDIQNFYTSYEKVSNLIKEELKSILNQIITTINEESIYLSQIIAEHHLKSSKSKILSFLKADTDGADGIDSAIDKMVLSSKFSLQSKDNTYIATAFGYEGEETKIDLSLNDTDEKSLTKTRNDYANNLYNILNNLQNNSDVKKWIEEREKLLNETKKAFLNTLGETRRPANDVTLWDHSFSVASLYKAALAEVLITEWKPPKDIKWKLLGIRFNGDEFYNSVPRIADVLGRKALVGKILDTIRDIIEVVIPIGNEIYRDENGSVFLVPESAENENKIFEIPEDVWNEIKDLEIEAELNFDGTWQKKKLEEIIHNHSTLSNLIKDLSSYISTGIFVPEIILSKPSRGALNLGRILSETSKHGKDIEFLKQKWSGKEENYERCSVCGLKPVPLTYEGYQELSKKQWSELSEDEKNSIKAFERKICLDCLKLAQNRVKEWWEKENWSKENPEKPARDLSIWLSEVADDNNRIGLVYLSFDLDRWLNGEMLNTFFSSPFLIDEFKNEFPEIKQIKDYREFVNILKECFEKNNFNHKLSLSNGTEIKVGDFFKKIAFIKNEQNPNEVFESIISSREHDWQNNYPVPTGATKGDNLHKAAVFLLHITRKHPSFARLRRIWETTKRFGVQVIEDTINKFSKRNRTIFEFQNNNLSDLKITHTYWAKVTKNGKEYRLEFVVVEPSKAAVIWNPDGLNIEQDDELVLYDESFRKKLGITIKVKNTSPQDYIPLIPYQAEPTKTMFFMPLKEVWEILEHIKKKYEIEFSKVQNRLPIKIGFIAFHKRTPMYAVLDAAKRLMSRKSEEKIFEVCRISEMDSQKNCILFEGKLGNKAKELHLESSEEKKDFEIYVSYSTGDPNKEDLFYPYFIVENRNEWKVPYNGEWKNIKHVKDIEQNDRVLFCLSYFDFLYLDTNTRRLDAGENRKHWLFKKSSPKPYLLQEIDKFSRLKELLLNKLKLTASQILNLYGLLIEKMQLWEIDEIETLPISDSTFESFVENTILDVPLRLKIKNETRKGHITREDFEFLKETILSGLFFDFIDMWHTVLKREFNKREGSNE